MAFNLDEDKQNATWVRQLEKQREKNKKRAAKKPDLEDEG